MHSVLVVVLLMAQSEPNNLSLLSDFKAPAELAANNLTLLSATEIPTPVPCPLGYSQAYRSAVAESKLLVVAADCQPEYVAKLAAQCKDAGYLFCALKGDARFKAGVHLLFPKDGGLQCHDQAVVDQWLDNCDCTCGPDCLCRLQEPSPTKAPVPTVVGEEGSACVNGQCSRRRRR